MAKIVVDPDGTRWVSVEVDSATIKKLQATGVLESFRELVNAEFWRKFREKVDADVTGLVP